MTKSFRSSQFGTLVDRALGLIPTADIAMLHPVKGRDGVQWFNGAINAEKAYNDRAYAVETVVRFIGANIKRAGTLYIVWYGRAFRLDWTGDRYERVEIERAEIPAFR